MPDYANGLVKVVVFFGVTNRVPATTPAHNVFCYCTVAHILTSSVNLAFELKLGFKNKCRACDFELGPGSGFKIGVFTTLCGYVCREQQQEIERIYLPPTSTKKID